MINARNKEKENYLIKAEIGVSVSKENKGDIIL